MKQIFHIYPITNQCDLHKIITIICY